MPLADAVLSYLPHATQLYHRLVLVVGPQGSGKTKALQAIRDGSQYPLVNLNLELSRRLLDYSTKERRLNAGRVVESILRDTQGDPVLVDNTEVLFDAGLRLDPLQLLRALSRNRTLVVTWSGECSGQSVTYAEPSHPEHRKYPAEGVLIVDARAPQPAAA